MRAAEYLGSADDINVGASLNELVGIQEKDGKVDPGSLLMQQLDASRENKPQFFEREIEGDRILSVRANPIPGGWRDHPVYRHHRT